MCRLESVIQVPPSRPRLSSQWSRGRSSTTSCLRPARVLRGRSRRHAQDPSRSGPHGQPSRGRGSPPVSPVHDRPPQIGPSLQLPREQPPLHPDQVFSVRGRPGLGPSRLHEQGRGPVSGAKLPIATGFEWSGEFAPDQEANPRLAESWCRCRSCCSWFCFNTMFHSVKYALLVMAGVRDGR